MKKIILILILIFSIIHSYSQDSDTIDSKKKSNLYDIQRNSLYVGSHFLTVDAFYERIIPIKNKVGLLAGGGIIQGVAFSNETNPVGKVGCLLGNYKHFFEAGILLAPLGEDVLNKLMPLIGYRYQNPKGFLFRVDVSLFVDSGTYKDGSGEWVEAYPIPGIAFGYSF
jgi:hypothetical protein